MSPTIRSSSRRPSGAGPPLSGTPGHPPPLPTHSDLTSLLAVDSGTIRSVSDARRWLESRGWILAAEPYDRTKLANVLVTAALTPKTPDLKNAALAVAFVLEANVTDQVSSLLAEAVAEKTLGKLSAAVDKLNSSADFISANDSSRAETSLTLNSVTKDLDRIASTLSNAVSKIQAPPPLGPLSQPTWASVAKAGNASPPPPARVRHQAALLALPGRRYQGPTTYPTRRKDSAHTLQARRRGSSD